MKVKFRKSGGFAPIFQGCQFDTTDPSIDPGLKSQIESFIEKSNIMNQASKRVPQARDVFYYTFDLDLNGKSHSVTFDQLSVPAEVKDFLEFMLSHSQNMMPD